MPPRDQELPEGTDHIINGAMEIHAGPSADPDEIAPETPAAGVSDEEEDR
jgi:hypothetical protein